MALVIANQLTSWSAVVRGAATKAFETIENVVSLRKCRRHYGTEITRPFDQQKHAEADSYICPFSGEKRALDQVHWLLERGQDLPTTGPAHAQYTLVNQFQVDGKKEQSLYLIASNAEQAPKRVTDEVRSPKCKRLSQNFLTEYRQFSESPL
jgi:hypothetical protein